MNAFRFFANPDKAYSSKPAIFSGTVIYIQQFYHGSLLSHFLFVICICFLHVLKLLKRLSLLAYFYHQFIVSLSVPRLFDLWIIFWAWDHSVLWKTSLLINEVVELFMARFSLTFGFQSRKNSQGIFPNSEIFLELLREKKLRITILV